MSALPDVQQEATTERQRLDALASLCPEVEAASMAMAAAQAAGHLGRAHSADYWLAEALKAIASIRERAAALEAEIQIVLTASPDALDAHVRKHQMEIAAIIATVKN